MTNQNPISEFLFARPLREQTLLAIGGCCIALMLLWLVIVKPIHGLRDEASKTLVRTQQIYAEVDQLAAQLEASRSTGDANTRSSNASMTEIIDVSLRKYGLSIRGIQPGQQGEVFVRLEASPTQSVWQWLYEMEAVVGVKVNELTINPTEKEGWVLLTARLEQAR
ncbi:type II secretion system protein M [Simiduia curdlanivorans]|uniref:Type II secretion system protein M n=1 Tax=Simiduia curdlanivorans TaxID=1492769 RepID=A0ABV8UZU8_9GAMM|nr:type II secretion system protein M [Simiduia curdlanivorans]MDN3638057.1 type II secretion system protein M [Simiduia curdlanivorans]